MQKRVLVFILGLLFICLCVVSEGSKVVGETWNSFIKLKIHLRKEDPSRNNYIASRHVILK